MSFAPSTSTRFSVRKCRPHQSTSLTGTAIERALCTFYDNSVAEVCRELLWTVTCTKSFKRETKKGCPGRLHQRALHQTNCRVKFVLWKGGAASQALHTTLTTIFTMGARSPYRWEQTIVASTVYGEIANVYTRNRLWFLPGPL